MDIAALRLQLGLTRRELADKLDMSESTIWRWEERQRKPTKRALKQLARLSRKLAK